VHEEPPQTNRAAARAKARLCRTVGIEGPTTVLADRIDGRSRRAARGLERARVMNPRKRLGLASCPTKAVRRRSVGSWTTAAKPASSGGLAFEISRASGASSEHSWMEGARTRHEAVSLTRHRGAPRRSVTSHFGAELTFTKASEEDQHSCRAEDNAARRGAQPEGTSIESPIRIGPRPRSRITLSKDRLIQPSVMPDFFRSS